MIKKNIRFLMLAAIMLCASSGVWATTYYLYGGNSSSVGSWSTTPLCTSTSLSSFSITASGMLSSGDHYFGVSTNSSGYSQGGTSKQILVEYRISMSGTHISAATGQTVTASSNCVYGLGKYTLSGTASALTIGLTKNGTYNTCNKNVDKYGFSITENSSSFTISTSGSNCSFLPTSQSISSSSSGYFDVTPSTGYKLVSASVSSGSCSPTNLGNATSTTRITVSSPTAAGTLTVTTAAITFTITAEAGDNGTISPESCTNVAYNGSTTFTATPSSGYSIDKTNTTFSGTGNLSYSGNVITISNITAAGTLSVEFKDDTDYTPVVHFGAMPTQGGANGNVITVGGYLVDRKCKTVSASGFYWGKSITDCLAHDSGRKFAAASNPSENGNPFSGTQDLADVASITTGTNIFFQAYVSTNSGAYTGYSDVVGFFYNPCHGISSVTLSPSSVSIAPGFEQVFSVVARSAGNNPTYVWKWTPSGGAETTIEGANTDTYKFTMFDPAVAGSLKVVVSEDDCGSSSNSTATISTCDAPDITLTADKSSTTPWVDVTLTATGDPDVYEWSATEGAEITDADESEATFRAPEGNYTVSFTASTDDCVSEVTKTLDIEVQPDSEQCNP